jgi:hypothetical protein
MYSIVSKYLGLSYLSFCMMLCALTLFHNVVSYHAFAYTAYASEFHPLTTILEKIDRMEMPEKG